MSLFFFLLFWGASRSSVSWKKRPLSFGSDPTRSHTVSCQPGPDVGCHSMYFKPFWVLIINSVLWSLEKHWPLHPTRKMGTAHIIRAFKNFMNSRDFLMEGPVEDGFMAHKTDLSDHELEVVSKSVSWCVVFQKERLMYCTSMGSGEMIYLLESTIQTQKFGFEKKKKIEDWDRKWYKCIHKWNPKGISYLSHPISENSFQPIWI